MALVKLTPNKVVDMLTPLYASSEIVPTVMLWGSPGVGKSDAVRQIASRLTERTKKKTYVHDVRLLLLNPVDLRGIPVPDANHETSVWLKPEIFKMDPSDNVINILFLDEINAAAPAVQASAYQLTLDRKIGEHALPDNCIIICAGNKITDKGVSYKMPTPLANRMTHLEVEVQFDDWKTWAITNEINPLVLGFLNFKETMLHKFDPSKEDTAFPTPRSWSFVSKYLDIYGSPEDAFNMIAGTIGEGAAYEFRGFATTYGKLPNINDILDGKKIEIPKGVDILYALSAAIVSKIPKATPTQLANVVKFTTNQENGMPQEFGILTIKDILRNPKNRIALIEVPEWTAWSKANKSMIH